MLVTTKGADASAQPFAAEIKPPPASPPIDAQGNDPTTGSTDSVSLSPAAQQVLAGDAPPATDGPTPPSAEALAQAADLLNDTTGKVAVGDQISAFALIAGFVANSGNLDTSDVPKTVTAAGAALYDSAFAQHQQQLLNAVNGAMGNGQNAALLQNGLSTFNSFSTSDQQVYLSAINLSSQLEQGGPTFASADSYRASLQAQIDAPGSATAAGGPAKPPGTTRPTGAALMAALAVANDSSGRKLVKDQLAAYDLLTTYSTSSNDQGPARDAVIRSFNDSWFTKHVAEVNTLAFGPIFSSDVGGALLDRLNRLTPDDQQIAFHIQSPGTPGAAQPFASLDSLKANDAARSAVQAVTEKIFAKFGGDDLTKLTDPRLVKNPAFNELLDLVSQNPASDGWTAQAKKVLSDIAKSLDLTPDDPKAADAAKALARLKSPPPVDAAHAIAMKTLKKVGDDLQQARDDNAAARAGHPHKGGKSSKPKADDKTDPTAIAPTQPQVIYAAGETVDTYA